MKIYCDISNITLFDLSILNFRLDACTTKVLKLQGLFTVPTIFKIIPTALFPQYCFVTFETKPWYSITLFIRSICHVDACYIMPKFGIAQWIILLFFGKLKLFFVSKSFMGSCEKQSSWGLGKVMEKKVNNFGSIT